MLHIVSVALLLVTMFPGSASAEGAWVLWSTFMGTKNGVPIPFAPPWTPGDAFMSLETCIAAVQRGLEARAESYAAAGYAITKGPNTLEAYGPDNKPDKFWWSHSHRCLPDTVDPRGPKR